MNKRNIPDEHYVVRHVGGSKINDGVVSLKAFEGQNLSVHWIECREGSKEEQIERIRTLVRRKLGPKSKFAELNVGVIRSLGLDVKKDCLPACGEYQCAPCHAEIVKIPKDVCQSALTAQELARNVIYLHDAKIIT